MNITRLTNILMAFILYSIASDSIAGESEESVAAESDATLACSKSYKGTATDDITESELECVKDPATVIANWDFSTTFLRAHCQRKNFSIGGTDWKPKNSKIKPTTCDIVGETYDCTASAGRLAIYSPSSNLLSTLPTYPGCKLSGVLAAVNKLGKNGAKKLCPRRLRRDGVVDTACDA